MWGRRKCSGRRTSRGCCYNSNTARRSFQEGSPREPTEWENGRSLQAILGRAQERANLMPCATPPCGAQSLATIAPLSRSEGSIGLTWDADRASNTIPSAELGALLRNQTTHPAGDENREAPSMGPPPGERSWFWVDPPCKAEPWAGAAVNPVMTRTASCTRVTWALVIFATLPLILPCAGFSTPLSALCPKHPAHPGSLRIAAAMQLRGGSEAPSGAVEAVTLDAARVASWSVKEVREDRATARSQAAADPALICHDSKIRHGRYSRGWAPCGTCLTPKQTRTWRSSRRTTSTARCCSTSTFTSSRRSASSRSGTASRSSTPSSRSARPPACRTAHAPASLRPPCAPRMRRRGTRPSSSRPRRHPRRHQWQRLRPTHLRRTARGSQRTASRGARAGAPTSSTSSFSMALAPSQRSAAPSRSGGPGRARTALAQVPYGVPALGERPCQQPPPPPPSPLPPVLTGHVSSLLPY